MLKIKKMELKTKINEDYMNAMKNRDSLKKNILSVVKGEIQTIEKNTSVECLSDEEVIKILNKTAKSLKEVIGINNDEESTQQLVIIESYLPKNLSKEEIENIVDELISNGINNIGAIMKHFSSFQVDRKLVSEVLKVKL